MKTPLHADPDFAPAEPESARVMIRALQDELVPGERLVWVGQPRSATLVRTPYRPASG